MEQVTYDTLMPTAYLDIRGTPLKKHLGDLHCRGSNREKQAEAGPGTSRTSVQDLESPLCSGNGYATAFPTQAAC